jgi:hypothetical protein
LGHGLIQGTVCVKGGHAAPPKAGAVSTDLVNVDVPVIPHEVALQDADGAQPLTTQSIGHGAVLHGVFNGPDGQIEPPYADGVVVTHELKPVPFCPQDVAEQTDGVQYPAQLMGQGAVLHGVLSGPEGHDPPYCAGDEITHVLVAVPVWPQFVTLHTDGVQ